MDDLTGHLSDVLNYVGRHNWTWTPVAFVLGGIVGSFANVCLLRWPRGLSVNHPASHCFICQKMIAWYDNLPLLSYLLLGGKCRNCQARFSSKYFWIECFFAGSFALLWVLEGVLNVNRVGLLPAGQLQHGMGQALVAVFAYHAFLLGTVLIASLLAFQGTCAPWALFAPALVVGIAGGTLGPWPWPCVAPASAYPYLRELPLGSLMGLQPTPPWSPVPEGLPPFSYQLGLLGGVLGALMGLALAGPLRLVTWLGKGRGGVDMPDVLLATTCGAFIGWPGILVASVAGPFCWLVSTPIRRRLALQGKHASLGSWIGWASLMLAMSSHWVMGLIIKGV